MRLCLTLGALFAAVIALAQQPADSAVPDSIPYKVVYKWGFINKEAGNGLVTMIQRGDTLVAAMTGHSVPWGGRVYSVRDSLVATVAGGNDGSGTPVENVIYESGVYTKPRVTVGADGVVSVERSPLFRDIDGRGRLSASPETMEAVTITADMLGLFRYGRVIDFSRLSPGQVVKIDITGARPGRVDITYKGLSSVNIGGMAVPAYHIMFDYEYDGSMSSYPVNCWIGVREKFPLVISADIKIGHVEMVYDPKSDN